MNVARGMRARTDLANPGNLTEDHPMRTRSAGAVTFLVGLLFGLAGGWLARGERTAPSVDGALRERSFESGSGSARTGETPSEVAATARSEPESTDSPRARAEPRRDSVPASASVG